MSVHVDSLCFDLIEKTYSEMGCVTFMFVELRPFFELRNNKMSPLLWNRTNFDKYFLVSKKYILVPSARSFWTYGIAIWDYFCKAVCEETIFCQGKMLKCKAEENRRRNYKERCTSYLTEMKELKPSIQVFRTHTSRRGQCLQYLLSKFKTSCQESAMKLRTAVAIAKLKASSPLFLLEKDETERLIMMANQFDANWEVPVIRMDVSVCHAKRLSEKPSISKILH